MTEFEKMRHEEFYDFTNEEGLASYNRAKHICAKLQTMTTEDKDYRSIIEGTEIRYVSGTTFIGKFFP